MVLPIGPLISAGASIIGSIFGSKKKNETVVNRVDYARMVADAEAAGFNPLTALRNGGSAGFTTTTQPVLSSTHSAVGNAISGAGQAIGDFITNFDPFEDKMREVQYKTMQQQLKNMQAAGSGRPSTRMFDVPAVSGRRKVAAGPVLGQGPAPVVNWLDVPTSKQGAPLPVWVPGVDRDGKKLWVPNPDGPDLEQMGFAVLTRAQSGWEAGARAAYKFLSDPRANVAVRPMTAAEKVKREESWLPAWVPRVKVKWD